MASAPVTTPVHGATIPSLLRDTVRRWPTRTAVRTADGRRRWTWVGLDDAARRAAAAYAAVGVRRGDAVALLADNSPEAFAADLGAVLLGAVPVSLYATAAPAQVRQVLDEVDAQVVVVAPAFRGTVAALPGPPITVLDLAALLGPEPLDVLTEIGPDDLLTIICTSGTTGAPKGVELTHAAVTTAVGINGDRYGLGPEDRVLSWLPLAHIAERKASLYASVAYGLEVITSPDPRAVMEALRVARPTWFFAVPRTWEKLASAAATRPRETALVDVGLDALRVGVVGAAPCRPEVLEQLRTLGLEMVEVYGMTENAACCTSTGVAGSCPGTVGRPVDGVELRLADDGEVLTRSATTMRGYRGRPEATAAVLDADGWLATGDLGTLDEHGCLTIVGRKKDILITAGGKNVSPTPIEAAIVAASPHIGHACVVEDGRPYLVAVVAPDAEHPTGDRAGLEAEVDRAISTVNRALSRPEQVKRVVVVDEPWRPGGEELTPTSKVRRGEVMRKHAGVIDALYDEGARS